jgi:MSHA pilin protein MshD
MAADIARRSNNAAVLPRHARGFSLIELIVTIVVTAVALTALGMGLLTASRNSANPVISMRAATLAQAYLDEILSKRFDENNDNGGAVRCGETSQPACSVSMASDTGETRASFDDVDDYNGIDESPRNALGNVEPNYDGFRVQISVNYAGNDFSSFGSTQIGLKKITLTVTAPIGGKFVFAAYRGNF